MSWRRYIVWCPDLGQTQENGAKISAYDPSSAVEEWAEWTDRNSAEYSIVGSADATVEVLYLDSGKQRSWIVSGESVPHYTARLIVTPEPVK